MPKLDRLVEFDERSREFPIRTLLGPQEPRSYTWSLPLASNAIPLDQGQEGACVGFAWAHEAAARPVVETGITDFLARGIYREAQTVDQWPGEAYEGTSVLAGAKVMQSRGYVLEYRWCFGLQDLLVTVSRKGPVVCGLNWYEGMFNTDAQGFLSVTGGIAGGHAILCHGVSMAGRFVTFTNSWGPSWGQKGRCKIRWDDMDRLLHEQGEACVPIRRLL